MIQNLQGPHRSPPEHIPPGKTGISEIEKTGAAAYGDSTRSGVPLYFILWVVQKFRFQSLQKEVWNRATDEIREKEGKH